ncbi:MAG: DNA-directed RNA polymerase subunit H [Candidatus Woesearchaeota archaeon]
MAATKLDLTKHVLVPKHTKLSEEEGKKVLEKFNITKRQLPRIKISDAAIANLEAQPGDIIKIERISPTVGKVDFYRVVTNV